MPYHPNPPAPSVPRIPPINAHQEAINGAERHRERVAEVENKLQDETSAKLVAESGEEKASRCVYMFIFYPRLHGSIIDRSVLVDILGGAEYLEGGGSGGGGDLDG